MMSGHTEKMVLRKKWHFSERPTGMHESTLFEPKNCPARKRLAAIWEGITQRTGRRLNSARRVEAKITDDHRQFWIDLDKRASV